MKILERSNSQKYQANNDGGNPFAPKSTARGINPADPNKISIKFTPSLTPSNSNNSTLPSPFTQAQNQSKSNAPYPQNLFYNPNAKPDMGKVIYGELTQPKATIANPVNSQVTQEFGTPQSTPKPQANQNSVTKNSPYQGAGGYNQGQPSNEQSTQSTVLFSQNQNTQSNTPQNYSQPPSQNSQPQNSRQSANTQNFGNLQNPNQQPTNSNFQAQQNKQQEIANRNIPRRTSTPASKITNVVPTTSSTQSSQSTFGQTRYSTIPTSRFAQSSVFGTNLNNSQTNVQATPQSKTQSKTQSNSPQLFNNNAQAIDQSIRGTTVQAKETGYQTSDITTFRTNDATAIGQKSKTNQPVVSIGDSSTQNVKPIFAGAPTVGLAATLAVPNLGQNVPTTTQFATTTEQVTQTLQSYRSQGRQNIPSNIAATLVQESLSNTNSQTNLGTNTNNKQSGTTVPSYLPASNITRTRIPSITDNDPLGINAESRGQSIGQTKAKQIGLTPTIVSQSAISRTQSPEPITTTSASPKIITKEQIINFNQKYYSTNSDYKIYRDNNEIPKSKLFWYSPFSNGNEFEGFLPYTSQSQFHKDLMGFHFIFGDNKAEILRQKDNEGLPLLRVGKVIITGKGLDKPLEYIIGDSNIDSITRLFGAKIAFKDTARGTSYKNYFWVKNSQINLGNELFKAPNDSSKYTVTLQLYGFYNGQSINTNVELNQKLQIFSSKLDKKYIDAVQANNTKNSIVGVGSETQNETKELVFEPTQDKTKEKTKEKSNNPPKQSEAKENSTQTSNSDNNSARTISRIPDRSSTTSTNSSSEDSTTDNSGSDLIPTTEALSIGATTGAAEIGAGALAVGATSRRIYSLTRNTEQVGGIRRLSFANRREINQRRAAGTLGGSRARRIRRIGDEISALDVGENSSLENIENTDSNPLTNLSIARIQENGDFDSTTDNSNNPVQNTNTSANFNRLLGAGSENGSDYNFGTDYNSDSNDNFGNDYTGQNTTNSGFNSRTFKLNFSTIGRDTGNFINRAGRSAGYKSYSNLRLNNPQLSNKYIRRFGNSPLARARLKMAGDWSKFRAGIFSSGLASLGLKFAADGLRNQVGITGIFNDIPDFTDQEPYSILNAARLKLEEIKDNPAFPLEAKMIQEFLDNWEPLFLGEGKDGVETLNDIRRQVEQATLPGARLRTNNLNSNLPKPTIFDRATSGLRGILDPQSNPNPGYTNYNRAGRNKAQQVFDTAKNKAVDYGKKAVAGAVLTALGSSAPFIAGFLTIIILAISIFGAITGTAYCTPVKAIRNPIEFLAGNTNPAFLLNPFGGGDINSAPKTNINSPELQFKDLTDFGKTILQAFCPDKIACYGGSSSGAVSGGGSSGVTINGCFNQEVLKNPTVEFIKAQGLVKYTAQTSKIKEIYDVGKQAGVPDEVIKWVIALSPTESDMSWNSHEITNRNDCYGIIQFCRAPNGSCTFQNALYNVDKFHGTDNVKDLDKSLACGATESPSMSKSGSDILGDKQLQMKMAWAGFKLKKAIIKSPDCKLWPDKSDIYRISASWLGCTTKTDGATKPTDYGQAAENNFNIITCSVSSAPIVTSNLDLDINPNQYLNYHQKKFLADMTRRYQNGFQFGNTSNVFGEIKVAAQGAGNVLNGTQTQSLSVGRIAGISNNVRGGILKHNDKTIPTEKKVYSPVNGTVIGVENSKPGNFGTNQGADFGNYIGIKISDGDFSGKTYWAGHIGKALVNKGDNIIIGQLIADMSTWSGSGTGPHWSDMIADGGATTMADSQSDVPSSAKLAGLKITGDGIKATVVFGDGSSGESNGQASTTSATSSNGCPCPDKNAPSGAIGTSTGPGTVSTGGEFTLEVRAFMDTVANWEAEGSDKLGLISYNSGNAKANIFDASKYTSSYPVIDSPGNGGRYQVKPVDDRQEANTFLKKRGLPEVTGFDPNNQDLFFLGRWYYRQSRKDNNPKKNSQSLGELLKVDLKTAIGIASGEWASAPDLTADGFALAGKKANGTSQTRPGRDSEYTKYYNERLYYYKSTASTTPQPEATPAAPTEVNFLELGDIKVNAQDSTANVPKTPTAQVSIAEARKKLVELLKKGYIGQGSPAATKDEEGYISKFDDNMILFLHDLYYKVGITWVGGPMNYGRNRGDHWSGGKGTAYDFWGLANVSEVEGANKPLGKMDGEFGLLDSVKGPTPNAKGNVSDPRILRHIDVFSSSLELTKKTEDMVIKVVDAAELTGLVRGGEKGLQQVFTSDKIAQRLTEKYPGKIFQGHTVPFESYGSVNSPQIEEITNGHHNHLHIGLKKSKSTPYTGINGDFAATSTSKADCNKPCPEGSVSGTGPVGSINVDKTYFTDAGKYGWKKLGDEKFIMIHYTANDDGNKKKLYEYNKKEYPSKKNAQNFKEFVEKGEAGNIGGWAHYVIDDDITYQILDESYKVQGVSSKTGKILYNNQTYNPNDHLIQYEVHYNAKANTGPETISDPQLRQLASLVAKTGLNYDRVFTHWAADPFTREDSKDWFDPSGQDYSKLKTFVSYVKSAGGKWQGEDEVIAKAILKQNIEMAIKVHALNLSNEKYTPLAQLQAGLAKLSEPTKTNSLDITKIWQGIKVWAGTVAPKNYKSLSQEHLKLLEEVAKELKITKVEDAGKDDSAMLAKFEELKKDAASKGFDLENLSSYRSYDSQVETYFTNGQADKITQFYDDGMSATDREKVKQGYINRGKSSFPPGYSEHHSGKALDIIDSKKPISKSLNRDTYPAELAEYLATNAPKFGFVLSYDKNSGGANGGAQYEPWHWYFGTKNTPTTTPSTTSQPCPQGSTTTGEAGNGEISNNSDPSKLGVTASAASGTIAKGGIFNPYTRAFLDTITQYESGDPTNRGAYSSGNFSPNDFDANTSADLHPILKSKGIFKTTVKDCTTAVAITPPFMRKCFSSDLSKSYTLEEVKIPKNSNNLYVSALNVGRYQYYGDHVTVNDAPGEKSALGYINSSPSYFAGDVQKANESLKKMGIDFAIKDFKPISQDFYPIGKYAYWAYKNNTEPDLSKALGDGSRANFEKVVTIASKEWASAPEGAQKKATVDQYFDLFNKRLAVYKAEK